MLGQLLLDGLDMCVWPSQLLRVLEDLASELAIGGDGGTIDVQDARLEGTHVSSQSCHIAVG